MARRKRVKKRRKPDEVYFLKKMFRVIFIIALVIFVVLGAYNVITGNNDLAIKFFIVAAIIFVLNYLVLRFM